MTQRYFVGGPSNSGKSTFILSLVEHLQKWRDCTALAIELDVWSRSYPAFRGEVTFEDRPKQFGLEWDWQSPLLEQLQNFKNATEDFVFGDMPGKCIDEAIEFMCDNGGSAEAIVISHSVEDMNEWVEFFTKRNIHVVQRFLSVQDSSNLQLLHDMDRKIVPDDVFVASFGHNLLKGLV